MISLPRSTSLALSRRNRGLAGIFVKIRTRARPRGESVRDGLDNGGRVDTARRLHTRRTRYDGFSTKTRGESDQGAGGGSWRRELEEAAGGLSRNSTMNLRLARFRAAIPDYTHRAFASGNRPDAEIVATCNMPVCSHHSSDICRSHITGAFIYGR